MSRNTYLFIYSHSISSFYILRQLTGMLTKYKHLNVAIYHLRILHCPKFVQFTFQKFSSLKRCLPNYVVLKLRH
jgi:hypothetical protein